MTAGPVGLIDGASGLFFLDRDEAGDSFARDRPGLPEES